MEILHITNKTDIDHINKLTNSGKEVFILIYMEGCGPCNAVRPEWTKLENVVKNSNKNNSNKYNNVVIAQIESEHLDKLKLNSVPEGFPTIKYISKKGTLEEDFNKERNVTALMEWVNKSIPKKSGKQSDKKQSDKKQSDKKQSDKKQSDKKQTKKYKRTFNRKTQKRRLRKPYGRR